MNNLRNKVSLIGYMGNAPELKILESGTTLAKFSVATNETYVNAYAEKINTTTWHHCFCFGKLADICGNLLKKGSEVVVEGKLVNRVWDNSEGVRKYITEVQVHEMLLIGGKTPAVKAEQTEGALEENELVFPEDKQQS